MSSKYKFIEDYYKDVGYIDRATQKKILNGDDSFVPTESQKPMYEAVKSYRANLLTPEERRARRAWARYEERRAGKTGNAETDAYNKYAVRKESNISGLKEGHSTTAAQLISGKGKQSLWNKIVQFYGDLLPDGSNAKKSFNKRTGYGFDNSSGYSDDQLADIAIKALHNADKATDYDFAMVNEAYERLSNSKKYEDSDLVDALREAKRSWTASPAAALGTNIWAAVTGMASDFASFTNSLGGDKIPILKDWNENVIDYAKDWQEKASDYNKGEWGESRGQLTQGVVNLIPYMVAGAGNVTAKTALNAPKYASFLKTVFSNPSTWYSLTSMWGSKYQEAIDNGVSRETALANAVMYAVPAALVEVSGGIGSVDGGKQALSRTIIEEIGEEIAQDVIGGLSDKATSNPELPFLSTSEKAVINPYDLAETAVMTVPIVAIGGGAGKIIDTTAGTIAQRKNTGNQIKKGNGMLNAIVDVAMDYDKDSKIYKTAEGIRSAVANGKSVSDYSVGKLYSDIETDIGKQYRNDTDNVIKNYDFIPTHYDSKTDEHIRADSIEDGFYVVRNKAGDTVEVNAADFKKNYETLTDDEIVDYVINRTVENELQNRITMKTGLNSLGNVAATRLAQAAGMKAPTAKMTELVGEVTKNMAVSERGIADIDTVRAYAQAYVEGLKSEMESVYSEIDSRTDNVAEAIVEATLGIDGGHITETLKNHALFDRTVNNFKKSFSQIMLANSRFRNDFGFSGTDADMAYRQFSAISGGDYSSVVSGVDALINPVENIAEPANAYDDAVATVRSILESGKITSAQADMILSTPALRDAFVRLTGHKIEGTKAEQRAIVKNYRNEVSVAEQEAVSEDIAEIEVAIEETLKNGAEDAIFRAMENEGKKGDLTLFAERLKEKYAKTGSIGALSNFFADGGKRVIAVMEGDNQNAKTQGIKNRVKIIKNSFTEYAEDEARLKELEGKIKDVSQKIENLPEEDMRKINGRAAIREYEEEIEDIRAIRETEKKIKESGRAKKSDALNAENNTQDDTSSVGKPTFPSRERLVEQTEYGYELRGLPDANTLSEIANSAVEGAVVTLKGNDAVSDATLIYDEGVSADAVKADIIQYYRDGIMPDAAYEDDLPWDDVKFSSSEKSTDSVLPSKKVNDIINENEISGEVNNNELIREYDDSREVFGEVNAERRLLGQTNQGRDNSTSQNVIAQGQGRAYPIDSRKDGSEKTDKGRIKGVYHGSAFQFSNFEKSYVDIGIHFGTKGQAETRIDSSEGNVLEYEIILNNPLSCDDIFGERNPDEYVEDLIENSALEEEEKAELREMYESYAQGDLESEAKAYLKEKIASGKYSIETEIDDDGIFVNISLKDDAGNTNQIPLTELIDREILIEMFGEDVVSSMVNNAEISNFAKIKISDLALEKAAQIEVNFLKLRKIEDVLKSFGYDGFVYENQNEGEGLSYAVFDDSQIVKTDESSIEESDDIRFSMVDNVDVDVVGIKEQIRKHSSDLAKMSPVFDDKVYVTNKGKTANKQWILPIFKKLGYKIKRDDIGEIVLDKKRVSKSLSYLKTDGELAAYSALPYVLKQGKIYQGHKNHKSRGYDTVTIMAPVVINEVRGNMAAVVTISDDGTFYKVYRILMPDGSSFVYENKKSTAETAAAETKKVTVESPTDNASNIKLSQKDKVVNSNISENEENDTIESEVNENEQGRNDILSGDVEGRLGESAGEQGGRILKGSGASEENGRRGQGTARSRRLYGETVRKNGGTEVKRRGFLQCEFVKEEYYSDDMKRIAAENSKKGITTHFFVGDGKHILKKFLSFRGAVRGNEIFIQCDNAKYSAEQINKHEIVHREYKSEAIQKIKAYIESKLTKEEKKNISEKLYANYRSVTNGNVDAIFEEFVCDTMAGMNDYGVRFENVVNEYWSNQESDIDIYSPAEYTESIDAGGKVDLLLSDDGTDAETSVGKTITIDMSDDERYEILKDKKIKLAMVDKNIRNKYLKEMPDLLNKKLRIQDAKKLLKTLGDEFGVYKEYESKEFDIKFEFGANNLRKSVNTQNGNYEKFAQMLSCFPDVISNAVGIEVHNRNEEGYKPDDTLKNVYVLFSAFENDTEIIPVKLSVKEFVDKSNRLYLAVSLESIKKDRVDSMGVRENPTHIRTSSVDISIAEMFKNVNIKDADFLKYLPNQFLNEEQIEAKNLAIEKDRKNDPRYSETEYLELAEEPEKNEPRLREMVVTAAEDAEYMEAYYDGDDEKAQELVDNVAKRFGYTYKAYHHTENAFNVFDLSKARTSMDIQGLFFSADPEAESEYGSVRYDTYLKMNNPYIVDSKEKANAIPFDMSKINSGITAREWLQENGYDSIIRKAEYYGAEADEYVVFDSSQIKSAEPYTYADDEYGEGDIIPLSERFNSENDDIRYSFTEDESTEYLAEPLKQIKDDINEVRLRAETRQGKIYTTADVRQVAASILDNIDIGTGRGMSMSTGDKAAMLILTNRVLNATESEKAKHIKRLSAFVAQKAMVYDSSDSYDYAGDLRELKANIVHSIALTDADKAVLDGAGVSGYKSLFGGGKSGVDVIYADLSSQRPDMFPDDIHATDTKLLRIVEMYDFLKNGISDKSARLIDVLKADDRRSFAEAVEGEISRVFSDNELGRESRLSVELSQMEQRHNAEKDKLRQAYEKKISSMKNAAKAKSEKKLSEKGMKPKERVRFESFDEAIEKFGRIKPGEKPVRDIAVPKKIDEKRYVSQFARTMLEAGVTPPEMMGEFEKSILNGEMTHERITNKKASEWATRQIEKYGFEEAMNRWSVWASSGKVGKKELALGMELYNQCVTNKDVPNAMKLAAELAAEATRAGQTLQACRMLKLMSPDGQLYYLEKSIQNMNEEFKNKLGDKFKDIELDEQLMEEFFKADNEEARDAAYDKICQNIADQIPATKLDKWNSLRYLAMLGNPRTHIRNIVGNGIFVPAVRIKNYVGAVLERGIDKSERTKSFTKSKEAVAFAKKDFEKMTKTLQGEDAKYATTGDIESKRTIFRTKWLEKLRTKNFDFLEAEDMWFLKSHYVDALARIITVRGLDVNSLSGSALENARAYAIKEAQAATYRDANALAEGLNRLQKNIEHSDNKAVRATGVLLEGVMPFKKTPLNIAKQGIQYSPVGILTGTYKGLKRLKGGSVFSSAEVIDDFAKGLTGTGIMLLGMLLRSLGVLDGADDEDKKKREFDKMVGEQSYALTIGGKSYTIDWATPASLPLFTGAVLYDITQESGFSFGKVVDALATLPEPLLELSVFSGISDVIESAQYEEINPVFAISSDMITSYLLQALPTVGGQASRMIDKNKREYYYVDKNSGIPKGVQSFIGQASSKIPFASYLFEPSIDEWGREESYGNILERTLENVASPGYYSEEVYTKVDKEIKNLYDRTGENGVLPTIQQKYYTEDNVKYHMSADDYTQVKKLRGKRSFELVNDLINGKTVFKNQKKKYSDMSDDEKVKAIKKCYEQAGKEAKEKMIDKVKKSK